MIDDTELAGIKAKKICYRCIGEPYLKDEIRRDGKPGTCSYCGRNAAAYWVADMAERIDAVFEEHFVRTSDHPTSWQYTLLSDKESNYEWERDGEPVVYAIMNAADMPEQAAKDIQQILEDRYFDLDAAKVGEEAAYASDSHYEEKGTHNHKWQDEWHAFEQALRTEARFFSRSAEKLLASVFEGIDNERSPDGRPCVVAVGPGAALSSLFRARVFQSNEKLERALTQLDHQLGPPPASDALAGRMNARGISVFYGANDPVVALAEIRPPVGSQVVVGHFEIIRPLRLLDLTALGTVRTKGSIFDPTFAGRLERAMFLRKLSQRITRPVMPDDEVVDYLSTQAVADFLASNFVTPLDGIIYPSAQAAGDALNIVLFHKAARVQAINLPRGTEVSASLGHMEEDGWETEYQIIEETPPKVDANTEAQPERS